MYALPEHSKILMKIELVGKRINNDKFKKAVTLLNTACMNILMSFNHFLYAFLIIE